MFFKNMEQVSVEVDETNGYIHIKQANHMDDDENIMITPDQIDGLITWLQEAKAYVAGLYCKE